MLDTARQTSITITVRLFARYRETAGTSLWRGTVPPDSTVADVWAACSAALPGLAAARGLVAYSGWSVNGQWARATTPLHDGDEVALLPPVSGG